ncbi:ribosomal protection-like ABC-F family protein [Ureibacillus sp. FSL K6-2830]|uniref:ribosomal protection-like ABC-F family protein n=1 Tax=Ureibacillus sp. FSL K6-2830 TaxID=2954610 RepID=UPI0030F7EBE3
MQELLKFQISYEIKDHLIFDNITGSVQEGDRIGIIGKNGAGKSTLLQLISKKIQPSKGQLTWFSNATIAMVEQEMQDFSINSLNQEAAMRFSKWSVPPNSFSTLSGGEKLKARLAEGISKNAKLLLLDEPTNHLDEESTDLLIEEIKQYNGTVIIVSHDRYFLDQVATKIWAIEDKKLYEHKGNYTSYVKERKKRRESQKREYEKQQKKIEKVEIQIQELSSWSRKAHAQSTKQEGYKEYYRKKAKRMDTQIKSKKKRLEKELEKAKVERVNPEYEVNFTLQSGAKRGKRFIEVKNLTKMYGNRLLFENANFTIQYGEKVAITGPNGSGKTTLLNIFMGRELAEGEIWVSKSASIGYLTQEVFDLPNEKTPAELFFRETFEERGKVQNLMKHLGFSATAWEEPIGNMSMGERVKCKLMFYILEEKDVLILDEPTNHLDIASREQLEETLESYNGTVIVVSHDRYFIEKTTNVQLSIKNQRIVKQYDKEPIESNDQKELLLMLETERQEVLGKLSFLTPTDEKYQQLDTQFNELTKKINEIKRNL